MEGKNESPLYEWQDKNSIKKEEKKGEEQWNYGTFMMQRRNRPDGQWREMTGVWKMENIIWRYWEETGLDVSGAEGGYVFTYKRENPGEGDNYFVDVYRFTMNIKEEDLHLQTEETDGYMFASKEQIEAFAKEGIFLHYDSIKQVFKWCQGQKV